MKGLLIGLVGLLTLGGCAASGPTSFHIAAERYDEAFAIAKDEVMRLGFVLHRVDARNGVIATNAVSTAGLGTPWTRTEASLGAEIDSFLQRDQRRVLILFEPPEHAENVDTAAVDRRAASGELVCRVSASREILHRPGLRLSPEAVQLSSVTRSALDAEKTDATIIRPVGEDEALSRTLARRIERRLARGDDRG